MRQNIFDRNSWHPPPLSSKIFCDTRIFLKQRRFPLQIHLRLWDEKFSTKNRDIPSYALNSSLPEISETLKETSTKIFATVTEDEFNRKTWEPFCLIPKNFRWKKLPETQNGSSAKSFGILGQKTSEKTSWYTLLGIKFSDTRNQWNTKRIFRKSFATLREDNFNGKSWHHLSPTPNNFRYKKFSETKKGSSTKSFGFLRQNGFDGKSWYPPPTPHLINFFRCQKLSETQKGSSRFFPLVWDKKSQQKIVIKISLSLSLYLSLSLSLSDCLSFCLPFIPNNFYDQITSEKQKVFLNEKFWYCETKMFWQINVVPYSNLILSIFRYQKFSGTTRGSPTIFCCYCETKNFPSEIVIYPTYTKISSKPEISELLKVSSTKCFSTVRVDKFIGKSRIPFSFTPQNFHYEKLSQT